MLPDTLWPLTPQDLQKVIYVDDNVSGLLDPESDTVTGSSSEKTGSSSSEGPQADQSRAGIRTLRVSPDGQHLASGDRMGVLRWGGETGGDVEQVWTSDSRSFKDDYQNYQI